jgi:hypothetical protein
MTRNVSGTQACIGLKTASAILEFEVKIVSNINDIVNHISLFDDDVGIKNIALLNVN